MKTQSKARKATLPGGGRELTHALPRLPPDAGMRDLVEWALTTLVLAFEVTTPGEATAQRMRTIQGAARAELFVIHHVIPDSPEVDYPRELTKRITRRAKAIINDGLAAPPSLAKYCNF